jgi:phage N-6-adenine-methyltransferase
MKITNEWQTPQWLFDELNKEFNFDIDLCATSENRKCKRFYQDYLCNIENNIGWNEPEGICFMNPPYSRPSKNNPGINAFIEKAWADSRYCKIVCLVKCDPSTKWWATFWEYDVKKWINTGLTEDPGGNTVYSKKKILYNGPKPGCEVRFFPKRIKFEHPELNGNNGPTFPCALVIMDRRGLE